MRAVKISPLLEDPSDARLRGRLVGFGIVFVCCGGGAFAIALFSGDTFDWFFGAVLLPLGVSLIWKGAGDILDRRYLVLFVVRVAVAGALAGALVSP
jgi:hypothetical protein